DGDLEGDVATGEADDLLRIAGQHAANLRERHAHLGGAGLQLGGVAFSDGHEGTGRRLGEERDERVGRDVVKRKLDADARLDRGLDDRLRQAALGQVARRGGEVRTAGGDGAV